MFSLIIVVVAIALTIAVSVATIYYGGSALTTAQSGAIAAQAQSHSQQIIGASEVFLNQKGEWPSSINDLVAGAYLKSIPAMNIDGHVYPWTQVKPKTPLFWVPGGVSEAVCRKINKVSRQDDGIYKEARPDVLLQCFGVSEPYTAVTVSNGYANVVADINEVASGNRTASNTGGGWAKAPTGTVDVPVAPPSAFSGDFNFVTVDLNPVSHSITFRNTTDRALSGKIAVAPFPPFRGGFFGDAGGYSAGCAKYGPANLTVSLAVGASCVFPIRVMANNSGVFSGSITFTEDGTGTQIAGPTLTANVAAVFTPVAESAAGLDFGSLSNGDFYMTRLSDNWSFDGNPSAFIGRFNVIGNVPATNVAYTCNSATGGLTVKAIVDVGGTTLDSAPVDGNATTVSVGPTSGLAAKVPANFALELYAMGMPTALTEDMQVSCSFTHNSIGYGPVSITIKKPL